MRFRVSVHASYTRNGVVEIEAETAEQAVDTVRRLGQSAGWTAFPIQWTDDTRQAPIKVKAVEEA